MLQLDILKRKGYKMYKEYDFIIETKDYKYSYYAPTKEIAIAVFKRDHKLKRLPNGTKVYRKMERY